MMVKVGNFLFHYRNGLFPVAYLLLFVPAQTLMESDWLAALIGFAVAMSGQVFRVVTIGLAYIIRGGQNRRVYAEKLVTEGMFTHCRNPLYVGNVLTILGLGLASNSVLFMAVGCPLFLFCYIAIILAEENFLRNKFGADFDEYCRQVNRIIPRFAGMMKTINGMEFQWRRVLVKEYGSTFAWMAGMTMVVGKNIWVHQGFDAARDQILILSGVLVFLVLAYVAARAVKKLRLFETPEHAV